jgi:hypothetical protein
MPDPAGLGRERGSIGRSDLVTRGRGAETHRRAAVVFTAAATGLEAGGPWLALSAVGAAGLAATPALVPRQGLQNSP